MKGYYIECPIVMRDFPTEIRYFVRLTHGIKQESKAQLSSAHHSTTQHSTAHQAQQAHHAQQEQYTTPIVPY